jgi:membrane-bound lytic murein transglycosylase MltF
MRQGGNAKQWNCLVKLWTMESHWNYKAVNSQSGSRGIPQALPANKMAQFGRDYRYDYQTQIRWGLLYIKLHWNNSACNALTHEKKIGWY